MATRIKTEFQERPDGTVELRLITNPPFGTIKVSRQIGEELVNTPGGKMMWPIREIITREPDEYLRNPSFPNVSFRSSARSVRLVEQPDGSAERELFDCERLELCVQRPTALGAADAGEWVHVDRFLDTYAGAAERSMIELIVDRQQRMLPLVWVNENVETSCDLQVPRSYLREWREVLEFGSHFNHSQWVEAMADFEWERSEAWDGGPRPRPYKPGHQAALPDPPPPFFAPKTGPLPKAGAPAIAGVKLPAGTRKPRKWAHYWATNDPAENLQQLVPELIVAYPSTGVWPLLWLCDEDPAEYLSSRAALDEIDQVNVADELTGTDHRPDQLSGPFPEPILTAAHTLLLVPANRPADTITMLGAPGSLTPAPTISARLRTWETRHHATVYALQPSLLHLSVANPPTTAAQAATLLTEMLAIADPDKNYLRDQDPEKLTNDLLTGSRPPDANDPLLARHHWTVPV